MLPTRATAAAALLLLAIVFPDGGGKAEAKGLSPPPQPIDDKEQADADAAEAASSRAASHDGADSGERGGQKEGRETVCFARVNARLLFPFRPFVLTDDVANLRMEEVFFHSL